MSPNNKADSDEFDEDDLPETAAGGDEGDVEHIIKGLDSLKRRPGTKVLPDPAWRRLERYMEDRRTDELVSDFDDYDVGDYDAPPSVSGSRKKKKPKKKAF